MMELTQTMNAIPHINVLGFDACVMGMAEVAYQFRGEADVMVSSESVIPFEGMDYQPFLAQLAADPSMTPEALGVAMVDAYAACYQTYGNEQQCLAAVDLDALGDMTTGVAGAMERFSQQLLTTGTTDDWAALPRRATPRRSSNRAAASPHAIWST
jgi:hypothetical protein